MLLNADQILKAEDIEVEEVDVPEWGGTVCVKALTGQEKEKWESSVRKLDRKTGNWLPDNTHAAAKLVVIALVNEHGERLFSDSDAGKLARKSARAIERLFKKVQDMSGLDEDAVEAAVENFDETPSSDSTSGSPENLDEPKLSY